MLPLIVRVSDFASANTFGEPYSYKAGTPIAPALEKFEVVDRILGDAGVGLELRDGKAVVLLSQAIPEAVGHVHEAFGIEVRRTVCDQECVSSIGQFDMLVHCLEFSAEDPGDHAG
jgi:hypothetical protein